MGEFPEISHRLKRQGDISASGGSFGRVPELAAPWGVPTYSFSIPS